MRNGAVDHDPRTARTSTGVDTAGGLHFDRISLYGYWQGSKITSRLHRRERAAAGERHDALHAGLGAGDARRIELGRRRPATVPAGRGRHRPRRDRRRRSSPAARPRSRRTAPSSSRAARTSRALRAEAPVGQDGARSASPSSPTGRAPASPRASAAGRCSSGTASPCSRQASRFPSLDLALRQPRTAVGQRADGSIVMVTVDGGLPGSGMTNFELGQTLAALGVVTGAALEGGRRVGDGVRRQAPEHAAVRRRPAARRRAARRVRRRRRLAAVGPGRVPERRRRRRGAVARRTRSSGPRPSPCSLAARTASAPSTPQTQARAGHVPVPVERPPHRRNARAGGRLAFTVGATDDLGRTSSVERDFTLDLTLGIPRRSRPR